MPDVLPATEAGEATAEVWRGASGTAYPYHILEIGSIPNTAYGNYIFARRDGDGRWEAIYVGQGDLSVRTDPGLHHMRDLILRRGATHVHFRENPSLPDRMIERADLLDSHPEAYKPYALR